MSNESRRHNDFFFCYSTLSVYVYYIVWIKFLDFRENLQFKHVSEALDVYLWTMFGVKCEYNAFMQFWTLNKYNGRNGTLLNWILPVISLLGWWKVSVVHNINLYHRKWQYELQRNNKESEKEEKSNNKILLNFSNVFGQNNILGDINHTFVCKKWKKSMKKKKEQNWMLWQNIVKALDILQQCWWSWVEHKLVIVCVWVFCFWNGVTFQFRSKTTIYRD